MIIPPYFRAAIGARFCAFALVFFIASTAVHAGNVFMVGKISVDATAASATEARALALQQGQQEALSIVLRRLTLRGEWPLLPAPDDMVVDDWVVDDLVEGFRVSGEKTGNKRYLATLSVTFKPNAIRGVLRARGTSITESQSRPALLVPVLENQDGLQAWGENWWRESWAARDLDNLPAPMTLPLGGLDDTTLLSAEEALIGHPLKLQELNRRYGTDTVIVAHALADVEGQLGVSVYIFAPDESDVLIRTYNGELTQDEMAARAIDEIMDELNHRWKRVAAVVSDAMGIQQVRVDFDSLKAWQRQMAKLDEANLIRGLTVVEMTAAYAYVSIAHIGTEAQLKGNLKQLGLRLEPLYANPAASDKQAWRVIEAQE